MSNDGSSRLSDMSNVTSSDTNDTSSNPTRYLYIVVECRGTLWLANVSRHVRHLDIHTLSGQTCHTRAQMGSAARKWSPPPARPPRLRLTLQRRLGIPALELAPLAALALR